MQRPSTDLRTAREPARTARKPPKGSLRGRNGDASARARILEAASKLFTRKPFDKISIDAIAQEAGVAHGLAFHYFRSKQALYEEVSQAAADRLDQIHAAATTKGSPSERLRSFLTAHMGEVTHRRADYIFHSRGGGTPRIQAIWERSRHNGIFLILSFYGVASPEPELELAVRAWLGYFDELVLAWVQGNIEDQTLVIEMSLKLFPAAIRNATVLGAKSVPNLR